MLDEDETVVAGSAGEPLAAPGRLSALAGTVGTPAVREIRADEVRRFLLATDPGGGSRQERQAPAVRAGDVVPPTFFCPDPIVAAESMDLARPRPYARNIDGGSEWEVGRPVRVGDVLTLVPRIAEVVERVTGDGRRMATTVLEVTAWNQAGEQVGVARGRCLSYEDRA
ncbi:MaoC family dehydratase N-terminal domain-containing protein [Geodermatophilus sp. YIM 151500]|uniref:MaoC family dehydratase N-terminal domain-containing protein n=1 Tax=Geodermatophilus sp. YIM 151500 TaxID=2984531 RepID=UPI0021E4459A|nr:MaoC family dehydratase N-terminal domain-containing protein [Geodermatophilus sp. YIM 151500]MCV2489301.1 MaoC family dehydratase N-terminal domain-containing protein [Geodermatophilus sp. YIM 151500]